jgi:AraC family transcriptional regulator, regulatory protein of adaptative response / DNA-3-methyladenine glycosylase II
VSTASGLSYQPPYEWEAILAHLAARAIPGVESVSAGCYRRTTATDIVYVTHAPEKESLYVECSTEASLLKVRRLFDLDADVLSIAAHLSRDPMLAPCVALWPGLRCPGGWDGFELAVRAVLGQQITVSAARQLAGRLVELCGAKTFPTPEQVASADLTPMGMPASRRDTLMRLAREAVSNPRLLEPGDRVALRAIRGIGEWTVEYIALRAFRDPDAFPASDVGLLRSAGRMERMEHTPRTLLARAECWRPWRAYAAQYLWTGGIQ